MDIRDKVAIVTGAGYGIGRGIVLRLAAEGAAVVVDDIDGERGQETVRMIEESGGAAAYVHADVSVENDIRRMVTFAEETYGGLDILVNNAGCRLEEPYFPEVQTDRWGRVLDVYLRAVMLGIQAAIGAMRKRGGGAILNISSRAGSHMSAQGIPEYAAAKAGVVWLTASLAPLKERINVRVNCICPGWVATETVRGYVLAMTSEERAASAAPHPDEMLQPADIGDAVLRLVRDDGLAGRVMLYYEPGKPYLLPAELDLLSLAQEWV